MIGHTVEVAVGGTGVTEGPPGVMEGGTAVLVGVLEGPPGVLEGTAVLVRVGVLVGADVLVAVAGGVVGVAVLQVAGAASNSVVFVSVPFPPVP